MIQAYVKNIATQMKMELSQFSMIEGCNVGCLGVHLLSFDSNGLQHSTLLYESELDKIKNGEACERLEFRIRSSLSHLKRKQDS